MLTHKIIRRVELPHEPGAWIDVRQLSYLQLDFAREIGATQALERMGKITPELRQQLAEARVAIARAQGDDVSVLVAGDPLAGYDVQTLLQAGIVAWSYDDPVTPQSVDELDEKTADYVARELVPQEEPEADRKNGSSRSTKRSKVSAQ